MDNGRVLSGKTASTRLALLGAFRNSILERDYDDIRVNDLVELSGSGRSTFYEHFESKEDLLRQSLSRPLSVLAEIAGPRYSPDDAHMVIEHFLENRKMTIVMCSGRMRDVVADVLRELIEERLEAGPGIPRALAAAQIAQGQLGLLHAWLSKPDSASSHDIVRVLRASTNASAHALLT